MQQRPLWIDRRGSLTSENRGQYEDPGRNLFSNTEDMFRSILQRQVTPSRTRGILKTSPPPSPSSPSIYLSFNQIFNFSACFFPGWTKSCCGEWAVKRWTSLWNLSAVGIPHRQLFYRLPAGSPCTAQDCTVDRNNKKRGWHRESCFQVIAYAICHRFYSVPHANTLQFVEDGVWVIPA